MASTNALRSAERNSEVGKATSIGQRCGLSEDNLVAAAREGRTDALDELWRRHAERILRITRRITGNREDGEDALQDSFLLAFVHIKSFDGRSSFFTWMTRIAINSALTIVRKKKAASIRSLDDGGSHSEGWQIADLPDRAADPEAAYARHEREEILRLAIRELRPTTRRAIELQQLREHSVKETAAMLGLSQTAAKSRLFHAKVALRKSWDRKRILPARVSAEMDATTVA